MKWFAIKQFPRKQLSERRSLIVIAPICKVAFTFPGIGTRNPLIDHVGVIIASLCQEPELAAYLGAKIEPTVSFQWPQTLRSVAQAFEI
jgi:hypothetical protein